jgi:hypothetical protein
MMYNSIFTVYRDRVLLQEYTQRMLQDTIARFQQQNSTVPVQTIHDNILHFEKVKDSDRFKKLTPKLLPHIKVATDISTYEYKDLELILKWFEGNSTQSQKVAFEPQEAPGVGPERVTRGDAVGLEIYIAHNYEQAKYLTLEHFGKFYPYCVRMKNYWSGYRQRDRETFYFVHDHSLPANDVNHLLVIRPLPNNNTQYRMTDAINSDRTVTWEQIIALQPKLSTIKDVFVSKPLTPSEIEAGKISNVSPSDFRALDYSKKAQYIALGNRIYEADYELLDKDLQNDYINAQDTWENIGILDESARNEVVVSGLYSLIWPFAIKGDSQEAFGRTNTERKTLGLYTTLKLAKSGNDFTPLLNIHTAIRDGTGVARKRYLFLLERNREKIFTITLKYAAKNIENILYLKHSHIPSIKKYFENESMNVFHILPEDLQKIYIKEKKVQITVADFAELSPDTQLLYMDTWIKNKGQYNVFLEDKGQETRTNPVICPFADFDIQQTNNLIEQSSTIKEIVDSHPAFKNVSKEIKDMYLKSVLNYLETYEQE